MNQLTHICDNIAYDHAQGMFMIYEESGLRLIPRHYIDDVILDSDQIIIRGNPKYLKEDINVRTENNTDTFEKFVWILKDFN